MSSMRNVPCRSVVAAALAFVAVWSFVGCSSGDGGDAPSGSTPTSRTDPAGAGTATPQSCPSSEDGVPAGAKTADTIDIDGDLAADQQWVTDSGEFGVTTTSGQTSSVHPTGLSGAAPSALIADIAGGGNGPFIMLVAGSRNVDLFTWTGCAFEPVMNPEDEQYQFDLTGQHGTGAGCLTIDGEPHLVGFLASNAPAAPGETESITTTVVELDGTSAENGTTMTGIPAAGAAEEAAQVSCGDRTLDADGIGFAE